MGYFPGGTFSSDMLSTVERLTSLNIMEARLRVPRYHTSVIFEGFQGTRNWDWRLFNDMKAILYFKCFSRGIEFGEGREAEYR